MALITPQPLRPDVPLVQQDSLKPTGEGYQFLFNLYLKVDGLRQGRITTGSIGAGASALVTLTWATAYKDTNYTVIASVLNATAAAASLRVVHIETISTTQVAVRVENTSAGALTGTLHLIGFHD